MPTAISRNGSVLEVHGREQGELATAWITGAGGLIGSYLARTAPAYLPGWRVRALTRPELDLTDFRAVGERFRRERPALVIHCAALTQSRECQDNPALARNLNIEVTARLAELAESIPFVFFSSDLVFDGDRGNYDEAALAQPLSVYGETKVAAEKIVLANPNHSAIRTSLNGGISPAGSRGFNEQIRRAWQAGETLKLYTDEFRCPLPAEVTARATWELAVQNKPGLYHVAGSQRLSRFQIGQLLAARWPQLNPRVEAVSRAEYRGPPRPRDTSLKCDKAQQLLSFALPGLGEWLAAHPREQF